MPSPAAPFVNDSNNANTDKRAGRPPLASAWKYFHPTPNVLSCKSQKRPSSLSSHTRRPRLESGNVGKSSPPCTLRTTAEHLSGEGGTLPLPQLPEERGDFLSADGEQSRGCTERLRELPGARAAGDGRRAQQSASLGRREGGGSPAAGGGSGARPPASRPPAEATSRLGFRSTGSAFFPRAGSQGTAQAARGGPSPSRQLRGEREGGRPRAADGMPPGGGGGEAGPRPAPSPRGPPRAAPRGAGPRTSASRARGQAGRLRAGRPARGPT